MSERAHGRSRRAPVAAVVAAPAPRTRALDVEADAVAAPVRRPPSLLVRLARDGSAWAYGSVAIVAIGFGVLAFTWGRVAGQAHLHLQLPLLVSGGLTGLALVFIGTAALAVHAWRIEGEWQRRELQRIAAIVSRSTPTADEGEG